jgi:aspartate carbamoyltransferase catalytic subunit
LMLFPSAKIGCVTGKKIAIIGDILHSRSLFNILRCKNWGKLWSVVR